VYGSKFITIAVNGASFHKPPEYHSLRNTITMRLAKECTIGAASGYVTEDGRPILWKVRDLNNPAARQQLVHVSSYPYSYIGVRSEGGEVTMGLNEAAMSCGYSFNFY
jgi:hypothetical protein